MNTAFYVKRDARSRRFIETQQRQNDIELVLKEKHYLNSRGVTSEVAEQPQIINKPCQDAHMTAKDCKQMQKFCLKRNNHVI